MTVIDRLEAGETGRRYRVIHGAELEALVKLVRATDALAAINCEALLEEAIAGPDGRCAICAVKAAREPLMREVSA